MRTLDALLNQLLRIRIAMGYIPNREWFLAQLNRQIVVDRAKAHLGILELARLLNESRDRAGERAISSATGVDDGVREARMDRAYAVGVNTDASSADV